MRVTIGAPAAELAAAAHLLHQSPDQHLLDIVEAAGQPAPSGQQFLGW